MPLLAVSANDIDTPGVSLDVELPVAWLVKELSEAGVTSESPGRLTARLSRSGQEIVVRGRVDAKLSTPCARCLAPAPVEVHTDLALLLRPEPGARANGAKGASAKSASAKSFSAKESAERGNGAKSISLKAEGAKGAKGPKREGAGDQRRAKEKDIEYEFSSDEADVDTFDGETVVLDGFVREAILLELPNFPLCSEACPGIGPVAPAPLSDIRGTGDLVDPRLAPLRALREKLSKTTEATEPLPETSASPSRKPASRGSARPLLRSSSAATKTKKKKRNKE